MVPVIGIPTGARPGRGDEPEHSMRDGYCAAIVLAGGAPILLPPCPEEAMRAAYERLDGLLLAGGGDVAPHWYNGPEPGSSSGVDAARDALEITLTRWALNDRLPVLAICRGIQVLNVAAGGTLIQDIPTEVGRAVRHRAARPPDRPAHAVRAAAGSRLAAIYNLNGAAKPAEFAVNSRHHQAIRQIADGMVATGMAPDGVVEAIEPAGCDGYFCLGVQWHPEDLVATDPATRRLFAAFSSACDARRFPQVGGRL